ncbi:sensor domain-containing protein, partial [Streptomyces macrosporus]|uniref:sensor domain-containing protein n=1 Tax=Streptomyces macrosporus TaxID=44032 RepID=UPI0031E2865B
MTASPTTSDRARRDGPHGTRASRTSRTVRAPGSDDGHGDHGDHDGGHGSDHDGGHGSGHDGGRLPPPRPPLGAPTVKEITHLLLNLPMDVVGFVYVCVWVFCGALLSVTVVGLPVLALGLGGCRLFGRLERARARALLGVRIDEPTPIRHRTHGGFFSWLWTSLKDPVGWRHALYSFIRLPWGVTTFAVTFVSLFVAWPVLPWLVRGLSHVDRAVARALLSPSDELERRIAELESDRRVVTDTASADLR